MKFFNEFDNNPSDEAPHIMPIFAEIKVDRDGQNDDDSAEICTNDIPILALRNMVLFPGITLPIAVGRAKSLELINTAQRQKLSIGVVCQKSGDTDDPGFNDLYDTGVVADIVKVLELPDNTTNVILQGRSRFTLDCITATKPYLKGNITIDNDEFPEHSDKEFSALIVSIK